MMKMTTRLFSALAIGAALFGLVLAGTLDPPGPPAPTMATLQQIYDRLGGLAGVARTGQTGCFNVVGTGISCAGTGQDGAIVAGVTASPRFTDNGNGSVTDRVTGLTWLKNANCFNVQTWTAALNDANSLASGACGLTDGSAAGTWRLPNIREIQSLIDYGQYNPALPAGHPFTGVQPVHYWSSTNFVNSPNNAFQLDLVSGGLYIDVKGNAYPVWPVRGGA